MSVDVIQRSDDWFAARCGSLGASQIADALATSRDKKAPGSTSINLRARLVAERLTGVPAETFTSKAMEHGVEQEANARIAYEFTTGADVVEVGLYTHPEIKGTHASPDGIVGDDGLLEIKCPNTATHIDYLKSEIVPTKYLYQMQWQMRCTDRQWCDFVSYDPRLPDDLQLFIKRVERDEKLISELEEKVNVFLSEVANDIDALEAIRSEKASKL